MRINNSVNFGWSRQTHVAATLKAVEKNETLTPKEKDMLAEYSKMPDEIKSEKGFYNNTHFYFPGGATKSYGKEPETNNALVKYQEHYKKALKAETREEFLRETAFALHFLQDVSTPTHTEESSFKIKIMDYYLHKNFERGSKYGAERNLNKIIDNYKEQKVDFLRLEDLFLDMADFSAQKKYKVSRFNKSKWETIQQECINRAINVSKEFVNFMCNFIPKI